jgi:superfamily I DNA/RNA helicase
MSVRRIARGITPSPQQKLIYKECRTGKAGNHFIVRARAGTGKTTTILTGTEYASEPNIVVCAFNKRIATELAKRVSNRAVKAKTLHAIGFGIVKKYIPNAFINDDQPFARQRGLTEAALKAVGEDVRCPFTVKKLITRLHTAGREAAPHASKFGDLTDLADMLEIEPDPWTMKQGYDMEFIETRALAAMELATQPVIEIDYADMIFLPVRQHWHHPTAGLVLVDEAQDMTLAQLELAQGICAGRMGIVGDDRQAIYAFRGADSGSLDRLKKELDGKEYGLTVTYRCGLAIVELAKVLVPDFEAGPHNPDGKVEDMMGPQLIEAAQPGDFILSRVNAPLAEVAMGLIRANKRCRIQGKDIGAGLLNLIAKLTPDGSEDVGRLVTAVNEWCTAECLRLVEAGREHRVGPVQDKASILVTFAMDVTTVSEMRTRINTLFTDVEGSGDEHWITLSSVHKAKGLEAPRVFVLYDTLRGDSMEEQNIEYVAITRAKETLVRVHGIGWAGKKKQKRTR